MAAVKVCIAEPWRKLACRREFRLCAGGRAAGTRFEIAGQRRHAGVGVAERAPHRADVESVPNPRLLVSSTHRRRRMVPPAVAGHGQCAKNLDRLYPLLTESALVEYLRGIGESGVGQERLHAGGYPASADAPLATSAGPTRVPAAQRLDAWRRPTWSGSPRHGGRRS